MHRLESLCHRRGRRDACATEFSMEKTMDTAEYMKDCTDKLARKPGVCVPWEEKVKELPPIVANEQLVRKVWEDNDALAYTYIWQILLSF
jgi:hypothetical protein